MNKFPLAAALVFLMGGCAIEPNTVRVEFDHTSHATQHAPFTNTPTDYGSNVANVVAHWDTPAHTFVEIGEGMSLDRHWADTNSCGDVIGPREQFTLRIGRTFRLK